jgi:cytochrome b561
VTARGNGRRWLTHWLSALLVVFLLLTALPSAALSGLRPPPGIWLALHMSAGWVLLVVTVLRMAALCAGDARSAFSPGGARAVVKVALLATLTVILAAGPFVYRPSPLQGPTVLFGLIEAPAWLVSHTLHLQLLAWHRYAPFFLTALLTLHIVLAFIRPARAARLPVSWLWRMRREGPP